MSVRTAAALIAVSTLAAAHNTATCFDCPGEIWFVDDDSTANGPGTSWATAFKTIKGAQAAAKQGDCIWVAEGTYWPTASTTRTKTFKFDQATYLYGGFKGTEDCLRDREGLFRKTILSGDIGIVGNNADNSYTLITMAGPSLNGVSLETLFDGFVFTGANNPAKGGAVNNYLGHITFRNCIFRDNNANEGGAVYTEDGTLEFIDCHIKNNTATNGAGIWAWGTGITIQNSKITGNVAANLGGGIFLQGTGDTRKALITNLLFRDNIAEEGGAMFLNRGAAPNGAVPWRPPGWAIVTNCTVTANHAFTRGPAFVADDDPAFTTLSGILDLRNSIVWAQTGSAPEIEGIDNVNLTHTIVPFGSIWAAGTNWAVDPLLGPAPRYRLLPGSPAIDAGDVLWLPADEFDLDEDYDLLEPIPFDVDGRPRIQLGTVDRGSYEL